MVSRKPPVGTKIDFHHPLTQGLIAAIPFNEGSGIPRDLLGNSLEAIGTTMHWRDGKLWGQNTDDSAFQLTGILPPVAGGTILVEYKHIVSSGSSQFLIADNGNNLVIRRASGNIGVEVGGANSNTTGGGIDFLPSADDGQLRQIIFSWTETSGEIKRFQGLVKGNAVALNQTFTASNGATAHSGDLIFGANGDETTIVNQIYWNCVLVFDRYLSEIEAASLQENPWQIFQPQRIHVPMVPAEIATIQEGPGTTVIITDVNGTETWVDGDTGLVITGTGFA